MPWFIHPPACEADAHEEISSLTHLSEMGSEGKYNFFLQWSC